MEMNYSTELKKSSKHQHMSRDLKEKTPLQQGSSSLKLRDELKTEKLINRSNRDIHNKTKQDRNHYKIRRDDDDRPAIPPKSLQNHQKQRGNSEAIQNDELVKYMSKLPCYLQRVERGQNLQEKALNFGVLDWGSLEKWQYNQKQIPSRNIRNDPSTSNDSSLFTSVGSSTLSGSGHSGSSVHQKKQSHLLFSNLNSTQNDGPNKIVKSTRGSNLQETRIISEDSLMRQQEPHRMDQFFCQKYSEIKQEKAKRKGPDRKIIPEMQSSPSGSKDYKISFCPKGKMKVPDGEPERRAEQLHELNFNLRNHPCPSKHKNFVLPGDCSQNISPRISKHAEFTMSVDGRSTEAYRKSFSDCLHQEEEVRLADLNFDVPHSCPLPCSVELSQESDMKLPDSLCSQGTEASDMCGLMITPDEVPTGQSKDKDVGKNKLSSSAVLEPPDRLDPKAAEVRNRLPNHRASVSLGGLSRSSSFKEDSTVPQLRSSYLTVKSGPVRSDVTACADDSSKDKAKSNSRGRSSPLRRLLDPLLKPKAGNHPEPSLKKSMSTHRASKSSDGPLDSSTVQSLKGNILSSCGPVNSYDSCPSEKHVESMIHALMQVTVKNGLPLFTFVVDSATDVLVATVRKASTTLKDGCSWVYTMYTVSEIKKKSGRWINQGTKGKGHGYASSVVAQMKVSLSQCPMLTGHNVKDHFMVKEFVLFGVELRQSDQETFDFHPNSELAAIVVKVPKENLASFRNDDWQGVDNKDPSDMGLSSYTPEWRFLCNAGENLRSEHNARTERFSTVVILPSGVHSLPSTGEPSSLIDRWKSGGSCDCGGWDVGCKLGILTNQQSSEKIISSKTSSTLDKFDLFNEGGDPQDRPVFSLAPFKKGIFSVDFHCSINLPQAFSMSIALINNTKPYDLSEVGHMSEGKGPQETMSIENDRIKPHAEVEPARYVHFPPLSPVGRV
ncbi:hypothetical protein NE237_004913 [Protea cynaroides]|uniref:Uncharacterized protein n=1 Tax=Protea cynaroides TaxID=273540 RepID=A0A9Q0KKC5_9MAGN|nr:hypothetical protein NE237_004913 [Protea cynaroides]